MEVSKETASSRQNMTDIHMNLESVAACTIPTQVQTRQNHSTKKGQWTAIGDSSFKRLATFFHPMATAYTVHRQNTYMHNKIVKIKKLRMNKSQYLFRNNT